MFDYVVAVVGVCAALALGCGQRLAVDLLQRRGAAFLDGADDLALHAVAALAGYVALDHGAVVVRLVVVDALPGCAEHVHRRRRLGGRGRGGGRRGRRRVFDQVGVVCKQNRAESGGLGRGIVWYLPHWYRTGQQTPSW